jgi:hypothetical protein
MDRALDARTRTNPVSPWRLVCLLGIGSLWGLNEILVGNTLQLTVTALFLLAIGRVVLPLTGSSTALAGMAVLFRAVNAAPFYCHLAGIAFLGGAFDLTATCLLGRGRQSVHRGALVGAGSGLLSAFLFGATMTWIFLYRHWPEGGLGGVADHTFLSGGPAAIAGALAVPLGLWVGHELDRAACLRPRGILTAAAGTCVLLWAVGLTLV